MASESGKLIDKLLPAQALSDTKGTWMKVGFALVVARLLTSQSLQGLTDKNWAMASLLTLLGFTAYHLMTARVVDSSKLASGKNKDALDSILKVGTMLVVSRLLSGKPLNDEAWMKSSAYVLVGFVAFDIGTSRLTDGIEASDRVEAAIYDAAKFGTMYVVSRYLEGAPFNREWFVDSSSFIAGLVAYDLLLS
jgi:hypothetical protein